MEIVDYDKKIKDAESFYHMAYMTFKDLNYADDGFKNQFGISVFEYLNLSDSERQSFINNNCNKFSEDFEFAINGQIKLILIKIGTIWENALKYILCLSQIYKLPNQSFEDFNRFKCYEVPFKREEQDYFDTMGVDRSYIDNLKTIEDSLMTKKQPLHNYDFLFKVLESFAPEVFEDFNSIFNILLNRSILHISIDSKSKRESIANMLNSQLPKPELFNLKRVLDSFSNLKNTVEYSGDSFYKLRYLSNNREEKTYDLLSVYNNLLFIIAYILLVHDVNENDITKNISKAYTIDFFTENMVNKILSNDVEQHNIPQLKHDILNLAKRLINDRVMNNDDLLYALLYQTNLSLDALIEWVECSELNDIALINLIRNNISMGFFKKFAQEKGISDIQNVVNAILIEENFYRELYFGFVRTCGKLGLWNEKIANIDQNILINILKMLEDNGQPFFIDNQINPDFYELCKLLKQDVSSPEDGRVA